MKSKYITLIIIGLVVILVLFSLLFLGGPSAPSNQTPQARPTLTIATPRGDVAVKDFSGNLLKQTSTSQTLRQTEGYSIVYFPADKAFTITLLAKPLQPFRDAAESDLLTTLNIDKGQACKLSVSLSVPYDVDANLSGKDFALSFCPTGTQF